MKSAALLQGAILAATMSSARPDVVWGGYEALAGSKGRIAVRQGHDPNSIPPNQSWYQIRNDTEARQYVNVYIKCRESGQWFWTDVLSPHAVAQPKTEYCFTPFDLRLAAMHEQ